MRYSSLKTWLTVLCLLFAVGSGWAATKTIVINTTNSGVTGSYADKTFTVDGVQFGFTQWMKSTNIQAKKSTTNSCYNVDAIPGNIKKITVEQTGTARAVTMKGGTSSKPTGAITSPTTGATMAFDFSGKNYTYFSMTTPGNAVYINTITIEYEEAGGGGGSPTSYNVNISSSIEHGTVTATPTSATSGTEVTLTATPAEGYEFDAWDVKNASTSTAITVTNNKFTMPAANVNVSATFNAIESGGGDSETGTWVKCSISDLKSSDVFVIVDASSKTAMTNNNGASAPPAAAAITMSSDGNSITGVTDIMKWNISGNGTNGYTFYPNGTTEKWLYCTATNNGVRVGTNTSKTFVIENHTNGEPFLKHSGTSRYVGVYSAQDWRCYTSITANIANTQTRYYKYTTDTPPTPTEKTLVSIAATGTPATFWKGDAFNHNGITVTATWDDETTTDVTASCSYSGYDMSTPGLQTVTVSYLEKTTTYGITVKTIANTQETAYTVTEAKGFIDAGKDLSTEVYVKGTISEIVTAYNSSYGNISFNISADGQTTGDQLQFYRNFKGADKQKWTDSDRKPAVGDQVVGVGKLTKYNTTYELAEGNYIVSLIPGSVTVTAPAFTLAAGTYSGNQTVKVSNYSGDYTYYYTTDGSTPGCDENLDATGTSLMYDHATGIAITGSCTLKMIAVDEDINKSEMTSASYTINAPAAKHTVTFWYDGTALSTTQVEEGAAVSFMDSTPYEYEGHWFVGWTNTEITTAQTTAPTFFTAATMDTEDLNYYAVFADQVTSGGSTSATTYTSNVGTLSTANSSSATLAKANISEVEYEAIKLGKSGAGGNFNVTIPAGTKSLSLHAAAWNGKSNVTLTLTTATDGVSLACNAADEHGNVTLTANSDVSNNTPFAITPNNSKEFFTYSVTGAETKSAVITITANNERALVWGVNASAGGSSEYTNYCTSLSAAPVVKSESSISIDNITLEVGQSQAITATTTPSNAALTYQILTGASCVSISSNTLTATAVGTASIKATFAGDDNYKPSETTFYVTVTELDERLHATLGSFTATEGAIDENIDYTSGGGTSTPFITNGNLRIYQNGGCITLKGVKGVKIDEVTITTTDTYASTIIGKAVGEDDMPATGTEVVGGASQTFRGINNQAVTFYCLGTDKDHRLEISSIDVRYTKADIALTSIELSGEYPTVFEQGAAFSHAGAIVTAHYSDDDSQVVTTDAQFSTPDMSTAGEQTVTVSYSEGGVTKTATYTITITAKELASIAVSGTYPTEFLVGETFSHAGAVVTATYTTETTKIVTSEATFSEPDMTTPGTKTVTVSYTEGGITKEATYEITVAEEAITTLTLAGSYPTTFHVGDTFSHEGMTITGNYNTDREGLDVTADATFTGYDMSTAGRQTVTVTYNDASTTYSIMVLGADVLFYESFDTNNSEGGNDNLWNGSAGSGTIKTDNEGWTFANGTACDQSIKLGTGSKKGTATTPALGCEGDVTLTFKAAAWDANSEAVTIEVSATGQESKTFTLEKGAWTDCKVYYRGITSDAKITFSAVNTSSNRFFLDEVLVVTTPLSIRHTATFSVNGETSSTQFAEDEAIVFPTPTVPYGYSFFGWTAAAISGDQDACPADAVTSATMGTTDVTYYAVFGRESGDYTWKRLTASEITKPGTYALLTGDDKAFNGTLTNGKGGVTEAFEFNAEGNATTAPEGTCELTFATSGSGFTMYSNGKGYLVANASGSGNLDWNETAGSYWSFSNSNWVYAVNSARLRSYENNNFNTYSSDSGNAILFAQKNAIYTGFCTTAEVIFTLNGITLNTTSAKTDYVVGETFSKAGVTVTANYSNGDTPNVTSGATFSEPDMSTAGVKTITVTYDTQSATYDITVRPAAPTFTPAAGEVEEGTEVTFASTTEGCTYYYTTDGTEPTTSSTEGSSFTVNEAVTLKVIAVSNGVSSQVATAAYSLTGSTPEGGDDFTITYADIEAIAYSTDETSFTKGSYDYGYVNVMRNNSNGTPNGWAKQQVIQTKASGKFYNKTAINLIKKIRVYTVVNTNTFSVAFGNEPKPTANAESRPTTATGSETISYTTYAAGGITGTDNTTTNYYDFTAPGDGAPYFQIINGSSTIYIYKVEITYEEGEGPTPPEPTIYAVTWNVNGTTNTDNYNSGTAITFPTSVATPEGSDKVFVGWTETAIDGTTDTEPVFVTSATATKDVTYYAVFATESTSSESEEYSFTLQPSNFSGTSYAANDGTHSVKATCSTNADKTINVSYTTANTMLQSGKIQFRSSGSALYNTTNLGTIKSVTTEGAANLITYYGSTSHPTSGTTVGGGYFTIQASGGTGTTTGITVVFETSGSGASTYSGYCTTVGEPTPPPITTTYAVTWSVNGETNSEEYDEGQAITFPTNVEVPSGFKRVFKGWVSTPITGAQDTEPEYVTSATATEDMTFYAVFAKEAIIGEATQTTLKFSKGTEGWTEGWTMTNCNDRSSYQVLTEGASIESPAFPIDQIKSISAEIRTYGNANNKTIDIKCGDTQVGTLTATGTSLAKKTAVLVEGLSLTGNKSLIFSSTEHANEGGPGVGSITIIYGTDAETIYTGYCTTLSHADDDVVNVTWMVNAEPSTESVELDSDISFPTIVEVPEGYTFVGWAATPDVESDTEPTLVTTAKATEDVTYYAVFAEAAFNSDEFILEIQPTDFTTGGYAANSGIKHKAAVSTADETVTTDVALQVSEVMRSTTTPAHIQFRNTPGFFYNTTDLGTITDVTIDGQTALKAFYGNSAHPTSGTTVGGGYFTFQADGATGYADKITITFEKTVPTYTNYTTTVYKESEETLTLVATEGGKYYATFSSKKMTFFPNTHANVRKVRSIGAALGMPVLPERCELDGQETLGYLVPAETGVLIESEVNNLTYYTISGQYTESDYADKFADNLLKPQTESGSVVFTAEPGMLYYKLAYNNYAEKTNLGFYYGASDGGAFKVKCGTAYLAVPENAGATSRGFSFRDMNDETEGLNTLQSTNEPQTIYNLQGLRMGSIQRGINIVNGRKVIR